MGGHVRMQKGSVGEGHSPPGVQDGQTSLRHGKDLREQQALIAQDRWTSQRHGKNLRE